MSRVAISLLFISVVASIGCSNKTVTGTDAGQNRDTGTGGTVDMGGIVLPDTGTQTGTDGGPRDGGGGGGRGAMCPAGACNVVTNGCPAGQACRFLLTSPDAGAPEPICTPAGVTDIGGDCTSYENCREGLVCDRAQGAAMGKCRAFCCAGQTRDCPAGQICSTSFGESMVGFCTVPATCNLLTQTGCANATDACYLLRSDGTVDCFRPDPTAGGAGAACTQGMSGIVNRCQKGFQCLGSMGCRRLCDTTAGGTPSCPTGEGTCTSIGLMGDQANVGACLMM